MKSYKYTIYIVMILLIAGLVSAVECDSTLSITPCEITSDLTLGGGTYTISIFTINGTSTLYGNGSTITGSGGDSIILNADAVTIQDLTIIGGVRGIAFYKNINNLTLNNINFQDISAQAIINDGNLYTMTGFVLINSDFDNISNVGGTYAIDIKGTFSNDDYFMENVTFNDYGRGPYFRGVDGFIGNNINLTNQKNAGAIYNWRDDYGKNFQINNLNVIDGGFTWMGRNHTGSVYNNMYCEGNSSINVGNAVVNNTILNDCVDSYGDAFSSGAYVMADGDNLTVDNMNVTNSVRDGAVTFYHIAGADIKNIEIINSEFNNVDFRFEKIDLTVFSGNTLNNVSFRILSLNNLAPTSMTLPSEIYNLERGLNIEVANFTLDGNGAIINGSNNLLVIEANGVEVFGLTANVASGLYNAVEIKGNDTVVRDITYSGLFVIGDGSGSTTIDNASIYNVECIDGVQGSLGTINANNVVVNNATVNCSDSGGDSWYSLATSNHENVTVANSTFSNGKVRLAGNLYGGLTNKLIFENNDVYGTTKIGRSGGTPSEELTMTNNIFRSRIDDYGSSTDIWNSNSFEADLYLNVDRIFQSSAIMNFNGSIVMNVSGIIFDGNGATITSTGINNWAMTLQASDILIDNIKFQTFTSNGIQFGDGNLSNITIQNSIFNITGDIFNSSGYGIAKYDDSHINWLDVINNKFYGNNEVVIGFQNHIQFANDSTGLIDSNWNIQGNEFYNLNTGFQYANTGGGTWNNTENITFQNNYCEDVDSNGCAAVSHVKNLYILNNNADGSIDVGSYSLNVIVNNNTLPMSEDKSYGAKLRVGGTNVIVNNNDVIGGRFQLYYSWGVQAINNSVRDYNYTTCIKSYYQPFIIQNVVDAYIENMFLNNSACSQNNEAFTILDGPGFTGTHNVTIVNSYFYSLDENTILQFDGYGGYASNVTFNSNIIDLKVETLDATNIQFTNNNFTKAVSDSGGSVWNNNLFTSGVTVLSSGSSFDGDTFNGTVETGLFVNPTAEVSSLSINDATFDGYNISFNIDAQQGFDAHNINITNSRFYNWDNVGINLLSRNTEEVYNILIDNITMIGKIDALDGWEDGIDLNSIDSTATVRDIIIRNISIISNEDGGSHGIRILGIGVTKNIQILNSEISINGSGFGIRAHDGGESNITVDGVNISGNGKEGTGINFIQFSNSLINNVRIYNVDSAISGFSEGINITVSNSFLNYSRVGTFSSGNSNNIFFNNNIFYGVNLSDTLIRANCGDSNFIFNNSEFYVNSIATPSIILSIETTSSNCNITNITYENLYLQDNSADWGSADGLYGFIAYVSNESSVMSGITFRNLTFQNFSKSNTGVLDFQTVSGDIIDIIIDGITMNNVGYGISFNYPQDGASRYKNIRVNDVYIEGDSSSSYGLYLTALENATFTNIETKSGYYVSAGMLDATFDNLTVDCSNKQTAGEICLVLLRAGIYNNSKFLNSFHPQYFYNNSIALRSSFNWTLSNSSEYLNVLEFHNTEFDASKIAIEDGSAYAVNYGLPSEIIFNNMTYSQPIFILTNSMVWLDENTFEDESVFNGLILTEADFWASAAGSWDGIMPNYNMTFNEVNVTNFENPLVMTGQVKSEIINLNVNAEMNFSLVNMQVDEDINIKLKDIPESVVYTTLLDGESIDYSSYNELVYFNTTIVDKIYFDYGSSVLHEWAYADQDTNCYTEEGTLNWFDGDIDGSGRAVNISEINISADGKRYICHNTDEWGANLESTLFRIDNYVPGVSIDIYSNYFNGETGAFVPSPVLEDLSSDIYNNILNILTLNTSDISNVYSNTIVTFNDINPATNLCNYDTYTGGNTITTYNGKSFLGCAVSSNYFNGNDTTDFTSVDDWSNISVVLERTGYGKVDLGQMNLTGKSNSLTNVVTINNWEIIVNESDSDYNKAGTLYFYNIPTTTSASDYTFLVDSVAAVQAVDWTGAWKPTNNILALNVTHLSTWTVDEEVPFMNSIDLQPSVVSEQNELVGSCLATDNDGSYLDYYYTWDRNGVIIAGGGPTNLLENVEFSNTYGSTLNVGDNWTFGCYASDELAQETGWYYSNTRQVLANQLPVVTTYLEGTVSGNPVYDIGEDMNAYCKASDSNGDLVTLTWRIYRDTILVYSGAEGPMVQNTNTLLVRINDTDLLHGQAWYIACKASDGYNETSYTNSTIVTIAEDARTPVFSYNRISPEIIFNDSSIVGTGYATDVNQDTLNYTFTLYINNTSVETKSNTGAYGQTGTVTFDYNTTVVGDVAKIGVVITDGTFNISEQNSSEKIVRLNNSAPIIVSSRMSPNIFLGQDDDVTGYCNASDSEGDRLRYNYNWFVNNISVSSGTYLGSYPYLVQGTETAVNTLSSSAISEGDYVIFRCQASDSVNTSDYLNTTEEYVYGTNNFAPVMEELDIIPTGSWATTQSFNITAKADDQDGNNVRFDWRIVKNDQYQTLQTSGYIGEGVELLIGTIASSSTAAEDTYYVRARAYDGQQYSTSWLSSNIITINNTPPSMENTSIVTSPYENTTLQVLCSASDIDDQDLTFEYLWYQNSILYNWTGDTLPFGETTAGEEWILSCRANDGSAYSNWLNSTPVTMIDTSTLPDMVLTTLTGGVNLLTGTCLVSDAEGDEINYTYKLWKDGILINTTYENDIRQGLPQTQIFYETTTEGSSWIFGCQGIDIDGSTGFTNSSTITIPSISFNYNVPSKTATTITVDWTTNSDTVKVSIDDVLITNTGLTRYIFEDLIPDTQYEITLQPVKDDVDGNEYIFNETTIETDNNNPTVSEVLLSPTILYTDTVVTGSCRGDDIESQNIFYNYYWYVNDILVDNGLTSLTTRDTTISLGSLLTSNYEYNDTIKIGCIANDGIGTSAELNSTPITVLNSIPELDEIFISLNSSSFLCNYDYSDADSDNESTQTYNWIKNNISLGTNSSSIATSGYVFDDTLICQINTSDGFYSIQGNSSLFTVGDFEVPVLAIQSIPANTFTDTSYIIEATCSDNIGVASGYPKIRFITPNYLEEEYPLFYESGDSYSRYHTFDTAGTYTEVQVECRDGNGNAVIEELGGNIISQVRETVINTGGSGGSGEEDDEEEEHFRLRPDKQKINMVRGDTKIIEFEIINTFTSDISITMGILIGDKDPQVYNWMEFENGIKSVSFDIQKIGGLSTNNKFIRYYITVPEDIDIDKYTGIIEINSGEQTEEYKVEIRVVEGQFTPLLAFLTTELFEIPFTTSPITGAVTGIERTDLPGKPFTVWMLIVSIAFLGLIGYGMSRLRKRLK